MNEKIKVKWLKALRSGKFKQTTGTLMRKDDKGKTSFCCLGVLSCVVNGSKELRVERGRSQTLEDYPTIRVCNRAKLDWEPQEDLSRMNDEGANFKKIADYIEKHL
jgi:hypothetical protein